MSMSMHVLQCEHYFSVEYQSCWNHRGATCCFSAELHCATAGSTAISVPHRRNGSGMYAWISHIQHKLFWEVYDHILFYTDLFQIEKMLIKFVILFSCVHQTSIESNYKLIAVELLCKTEFWRNLPNVMLVIDGDTQSV